MSRYDSTRATWARLWQQATFDAELHAATSARSLRTLALFASYLPRHGLILEAGSGLGAVLALLERRGHPVMGLDYAPNALHAARAAGVRAPMVAADVHALPFADQSLAAYLSFGVLEHFEQGMGPALAEARRALASDGVLVLTIPYPNLVRRAVQTKRALAGQAAHHEDGFYEADYDQHALAGAVAAAGFRVLALHPTGHDFTLWGLGGPFRAPGYYRTSALAEHAGAFVQRTLPWALSYMTLLLARKR